jgi:hypothetical protein
VIVKNKTKNIGGWERVKLSMSSMSFSQSNSEE